MIEIDREITQDYERALGLEWLETNGLGDGRGPPWPGRTAAASTGCSPPPPSCRPAAPSCSPVWTRPSTWRGRASALLQPVPRRRGAPGVRAPDRLPPGPLPHLRVRGRRSAAAQDRRRPGRREHHPRALRGGAGLRPLHPLAPPLPRRPRERRPDPRRRRDLAGDPLRGRRAAPPPLRRGDRHLPPGAGCRAARQPAVVVPLRVRGGPPAGARVPGGSLDSGGLRPRADGRRPSRDHPLDPGPGGARRLRPVRQGAQAAGEDRPFPPRAGRLRPLPGAGGGQLRGAPGAQPAGGGRRLSRGRARAAGTR